MRVCRILGFVLAIFIVSSGVAQAAPVTLSSLIDQNGTLTIGDKTFADFGFSCPTANCGSVTASAISVEAEIVGGVYFLNFTGNMLTTSTSPIDFIIRYTVTASAGVIVGIDQSFQPTALLAGGVVSFTESAHSGSFAGPQVAISTIGFVGAAQDISDPDAEISDDLVIDPGLSKIWVVKDVNMVANQGGQVGTSVLRQSFHQNVPEPASLLLLGTGLAGLAAWRKGSK